MVFQLIYCLNGQCEVSHVILASVASINSKLALTHSLTHSYRDAEGGPATGGEEEMGIREDDWQASRPAYLQILSIQTQNTSTLQMNSIHQLPQHTFVPNQTGNIVSLKECVLSIIKSSVNVIYCEKCSSSERKCVHLSMRTLTASTTRRSGVSAPVDSTETGGGGRKVCALNQWLLTTPQHHLRNDDRCVHSAHI